MGVIQSNHPDFQRFGADSDQVFLVAESMRRIMRRKPPQNPVRVQSIPQISQSEIVKLDFASMDAAQLPPGTFQVCCTMSAIAAEHIVKLGLISCTLSMYVRLDGTLVVVATNGAKTLILEEA
jgi:hypothetical protein